MLYNTEEYFNLIKQFFVLDNSTLQIMIKQQLQDNLLSGDIDIHQTRNFLKDPDDSQTHVITNILVYCSFYYPHTKSLIHRIIFRLASHNSKKLLVAVTHLHSCLQREVIVGPSSSHIPPAELPHLQRMDSSLITTPKTINNLQEFVNAIAELDLKDIFPQNRVSELTWYSCSRLLSMRNTQLYRGNYKLYAQQLEIDGQNWLQSTPFSNIFCFLQHVLAIITDQVKIERQIELKFRLLAARLAYLHNKILQSPVKRLSDISLKNYREILNESVVNITFEDYIQLLVEYSFCLLYYYKYSQSQAVLHHCFSLIKIKKEFTGKLGRRTKYQQFDTPQLVMNLSQQQKNEQKDEYIIQEEEQNQSIKLVEAKTLVARERGLNPVNEEDKIKCSTYDEQSILLETPKFVQQTQKTEKVNEVTAQHLLVTLASIYYEWRSTPHDQMLYQHVSASIMTLLKYQISTSFSYSFSILLLRSLNEFPRIKHTERALDQLEKLRALFNGRSNKNTHNLYSTPYETNLGYVLVLADKYMELGLSLTAVELFEQAGLYEECIDALVKKNYKEKALELLNKFVNTQGHNARTLCMLGDINGNQINSYEQAWKISKNTCARAQRSLGWYYFGKNQYQLAAESFVKATQANYYNPNTWFTLGCTYMRLNQFDKALKAFSESISIDDTQGEAWGNMASCYMYQKKMKEAYSTLEQSVRYAEGNWKLWANLLSVSLSLKKFYKFFDCIEHLVKLGQQQILTEDILKKIVQIMKFKIQEKQERRRILYNCRNRIDRLFVNLQHQIGQNPLVWKCRSEYKIATLDYLKVLEDYYGNLYLNNQVDLNDLIPGYENADSIALTTNRQVRETKRLVVEYKQCELNMTMRVGWSENKTDSAKVKKVLLEYVEIYRDYSEKIDQADFKLFVAGVSQKIAHCLQENFSVEINWL